MARQLSSGTETRSVGNTDSFYKRLVAGAVDAIITIDEHSRVLLWNPAAEEMFGYPESEVMGQDIARLIIPENYREAHYDGIKRMLETGEAPLMGRTMEVKALRSDATTFTAELSLFQPDENILQYTAIIRDVSRRTSLETEQRKLAASVVEDIRNETDLPIVLQKIVDGIGRLVKAERCAIWFYDSSSDTYEMPFEYRASESMPWLRDTVSPTMPVLTDALPREELAAIHDVADHSPISDLDHQILEERNIRSLLHVPVVYHDEMLGLIRLDAAVPRIWTENTVAIVRKLAGQAAVAIRHSRIIREQKKALARERLTRQVTELASSALSLETYMRRVTELIGRYFEADRCLVIRYDVDHPSDVSLIQYLSEGIEPMKESVIPADRVYEASQRLPQGRKLLFHFDDPADAPEFGRSVIKDAGIISAVSMKVDYYGLFFGYVVVHHCRCKKVWAEDEIRFLEDLAVHLGNAFFQTDLLDKEQNARRQAEESHERYALVLDGSNDGLYDWDLLNDSVYWNDRFYEIVGLTRQELPHPTLENFGAMIHPEDHERAVAEIQDHLSEPRNYSMEYRIRHKDGSYRYVTCRGKTVFRDGRPVRMSGLVRDVTGRKLAEKALRENEARERLKREILETISKTSDIQFILREVAERIGTGLNADRASVSRYRHHVLEDGEEIFDFDISAQYRRDESICEVDPAMIPAEVMQVVAQNIPKIYAIKTIVASTRQMYVEDMESRVQDLVLPPERRARLVDQMKALMFERLGVKSHLRVPVEYRGTVYGTVTVQHCLQEHHWTPEEVRLVEEIGGYVGSAMYQSDLLRQEQEARADLETSNALLSIISETQNHFITRESIYTLFEKPLSGLLTLTQSEYGFIGEVLYDNQGKPYLKCNILSDISWNDETRNLYEEYRQKGMEFHDIDNLFGEVLKTGEVVIANDPDNDPRSSGRPAGHPPLKSFLGMPFKQNGRLIGMVGIANRPGGYDESIVEMLEPFLVACANIIQGNRSEKLREDMTVELQRNDIALRAYAARLEQSNKDLEDFAVIASHDLQEPLRKIRIFGDRLKSKAADELSEENLMNIERIQAATHRMQDLISSLMFISRINRRGRPFESVDLRVVLENVIQDHEVLIQETGGRVEVGRTLTVSADPVQMRQLFGNLVSNALKFHRPDFPPVVRVDMIRQEEELRITVEDNGIGFEEKYLERIFEPFRRLHGADRYPGTGVGLAICRKIVERHGGSITATGKPDSGAVFIITLPVKPTISL